MTVRQDKLALFWDGFNQARVASSPSIGFGIESKSSATSTKHRKPVLGIVPKLDRQLLNIAHALKRAARGEGPEAGGAGPTALISLIAHSEFLNPSPVELAFKRNENESAVILGGRLVF